MIIAVKDGDRVVMAVSGNETQGFMSERDLVNEDNILIKVIADKPECFVGFVNAGMSTDIFLCDDDFLLGEINEDTLRRKVIPEMLKKYAEYGGTQKEGWDNGCIIVNGNRIFVITPKGYLREEDDFVCNGSGIELLLGSLDSTKGLPAERRIREAVHVHDTVRNVCCYPLVVIDNKTRKIEIWRE